MSTFNHPENHATKAAPKKPFARESAQYIADMILELRNMAKSGELKALQGILEFAYYEAFSAAHRVEVSAEELVHLDTIASDVRRAEGA